MSQETHPLLVTRFEVIADYPHSPYKIGDIISDIERGSVHLTSTPYDDTYDKNNTSVANYFNIDSLKGYPALFRPLPWHERRELSELPMYVKVGDDEDELNGQIVKVVSWVFHSDYLCKIDHEHYDGISIFTSTEPATEAEYTDYVNSKSK